MRPPSKCFFIFDLILSVQPCTLGPNFGKRAVPCLGHCDICHISITISIAMASLPKSMSSSSVKPSSTTEFLSTEIPIHEKGDMQSSMVETSGTEVQNIGKFMQERVHNRGPDKKSVLMSTKLSKRGAKHGLAPTGMAIPLQKKAFRVGGSNCAKSPLKESNEEKYHRIKAEQEGRKIRWLFRSVRGHARRFLPRG